MSQFRSVCLVIAVLLALSRGAMAADTELVAMLRLVAKSPGGTASEPIPIDMYAEPAFHFEVGIRDDVPSGDFEEYLSRRIKAFSAHYIVEVYDHGHVTNYDPDSAGSLWTFIYQENSRFVIPPELPAGHVLSWSVLAAVEDSVAGDFELRSEPIYFHTNGFRSLISQDIPVSHLSFAHGNSLRLVGSIQEAEYLACKQAINGSSNYVNYPVASDLYVCSSIARGRIRPLESPSSEYRMKLMDLLDLGNILVDSEHLRISGSSSGNYQDILIDVSSRCLILFKRISDNDSNAPGTIEDLLQISLRLSADDQSSDAETQALLSELVVLGDSLAGVGTFSGNESTYIQDYFRSTDNRLRLLSNMEPSLYQILGQERGIFWQEFYRSQRAELSLLREDYRLGLITDDDLLKMMEEARKRALGMLSAGYPPYGVIKSAELVSAFAKLAPSEDRDIAASQILESQLAEIAEHIWPESDR